jgi:hypothetical protein
MVTKVLIQAGALLSALLIASSVGTRSAGAQQVLKGGVEEENLRLAPAAKPGASLKGAADNSLRISRTPLAGSAVDSSAFAAPLTPRNSPLSSGVVDTNAFAQPPKNFDIGTERGSKELVLAWEKWHHQLSQAIYERWQRVAQEQGKATIKVTVTRDRHIVAQVLSCHSSDEFQGEILAAISSLNLNPGLTFPSESQRQQVSFEADYIAGTNIRPGYSWKKDDYEKVKEDY